MKRIGILVATVVAFVGATAAWASAHGGSQPGLNPTSSNHVEPADDRGGLRPPGVSDDPTGHDVGDDKGGLRPPGVSDDPTGGNHVHHHRHGGHGDDNGPGHH